MKPTHPMHAALILGVVLYELRQAGRISEDGADTIASLAIPESCWGPSRAGMDLHNAVAQAIRPRWFAKYGGKSTAPGSICAPIPAPDSG